LDGSIAGVGFEQRVDASLEHVDLTLVELDEVAHRVDAGAVGLGQLA
jgi:hypothetical protein